MNHTEREQIKSALEKLTAWPGRRSDQWNLNVASAILSRLLESDPRPFDPALCGFVCTSEDGDGPAGWATYENKVLVLQKHNKNRLEIETIKGHPFCVDDAPWPSSQSDGETLLRLLEIKTEGGKNE